MIQKKRSAPFKSFQTGSDRFKRVPILFPHLSIAKPTSLYWGARTPKTNGREISIYPGPRLHPREAEVGLQDVQSSAGGIHEQRDLFQLREGDLSIEMLEQKCLVDGF